MSGSVVLKSGTLLSLDGEEGSAVFYKAEIKTFQPPPQSGGKRMVGSGDRKVPPSGARPFPPASAKYQPYPASGDPPIMGSGARGMADITPAGDSGEGGEGAEVESVAALMAQRRAAAGKSLMAGGSVVIVKADHPKPQGKERIFGIPILIENKKGSVRRGKDPDGVPWRTVMRDHYGEFTGVPGTDGDYLDVFIGPEARKIKKTDGKEGVFDKVWVIHAKDKDTGRYDEDKVMFGYKTKEDAVRAFKQHYDQPEKFMGPVNEYSLLEFKDKIEGLKGKKKGKRLGRGRFPKM